MEERMQMEQEVTLEQMLEARERRVQRQRTLLDRYGQSLICLTMNVAGPVKTVCSSAVAFSGLRSCCWGSWRAGAFRACTGSGMDRLQATRAFMWSPGTPPPSSS